MKRQIAIAVGLPLAATALQWLLWPWISPFVWFLFFPTVFIVARLTGFFGAILSACVSAALVWFAFVSPQWSFFKGHYTSLWSVVLFIGMGYLFGDIQERLNQARRKAESRFDKTFDEAAIGIALVQPDGRMSRVNRRLTEIFGYEASDLVGMSVRDFTDPADIERTDRAFRTLLAGDVPHLSFEKRYIARDGRVFWGGVTAALVRQSDGSPDCLVTMVEDIDQRKRTQDELEASEARLKLFIEYSPAALAMFDRDMRYLEVSRRWREGYQLGRDIIGRSHYDIFPDIPESWRDAHRRGLAGEVVSSREDRFKRADGRERWLFWEIRPWRAADGSVGGIVIYNEDLTEVHKAREEVLRLNADLERRVEERTAELVEARKKAEAASAAKSAFLANMSHEIRTPMNAILGFARLLQRENADPQQAHRLEKIDAAGRHLMSVISDILDFSKIEAGRVELESADFELVPLIDGVRSIVAADALAKGLSVTVDADDMPLWLNGDAARLRQALLNYAYNAVKFTERGSIVIAARLLEERDGVLHARFEVRDTGVGVGPQALARLFEAFEQADVSTTRKYGGTGLGLAITKRLAAIMGGTVGAESEPGRGSVFWFTANLKRGVAVNGDLSPAQGEALERRLRAYTNARVLVVEDNAINQEVALALLGHVGLHADTANDGREALRKAEAGDYALILMDLQMPEMDGLAATRALRATAAWADKPIVAMTANVRDEDRRACLEAGMNDLIAKPIDPDRFYAVIENFFARADIVANASTAEPNAQGAPTQGSSGVDEAATLARMRGDRRLLTNLLRRFAESYAGAVEPMRRALQSGDRSTLARNLHSLKGVAATLGMAALRDKVADLEGSIERGADVDALAPSFDDIAAEIAALVEWIAARPAEAEPAPANDSDARATLDELSALLAAADMRSKTFVTGRAALLQTALGSQWPEFADKVGNFWFRDAYEILARARASGN